MSNDTDVRIPEAYAVVMDQVHHMENRAWATFGGFLTANSIVLLAWATLFKDAPKAQEVASNTVMICLAVIGFLSGLAWALLCVRNLEYGYEFATEGREIERMAGPEGWRLSKVEDRVQGRWTPVWVLSHQPVVMCGTALCFSAVYVVLSGIVLLSLDTPGAVVTVLAVLAAGVAVFAVARQCASAMRGAREERKRRGLAATRGTG